MRNDNNFKVFLEFDRDVCSVLLSFLHFFYYLESSRLWTCSLSSLHSTHHRSGASCAARRTWRLTFSRALSKQWTHRSAPIVTLIRFSRRQSFSSSTTMLRSFAFFGVPFWFQSYDFVYFFYRVFSSHFPFWQPWHPLLFSLCDPPSMQLSYSSQCKQHKGGAKQVGEQGQAARRCVFV
jgi:hypothetical protein